MRRSSRYKCPQPKPYLAQFNARSAFLDQNQLFFAGKHFYGSLTNRHSVQISFIYSKNHLDLEVI